MATDLLIHASAAVATFAAVSIGSYGLMRQLALLGLFPLPRRAGGSWHGGIAHRLGEVAAARGWFASVRTSARRDLVRARLVDITPEDFVGTSLLYAIVTALIVWGLTMALGGRLWNVIPALVAAFVVFQMPEWNLKSRADHRLGEITHRLPYSLEVIVLATESGAIFEEALTILVREDPSNPLHEEFDQVLRDAALGLKRQEALHNMAARVGTEDLLALVLSLDIADNLGTPTTATLKKESETIRSRRLQRAERMAREAGPKMALPNTMIMVANVLLILGPFLPKLSLSNL